MKEKLAINPKKTAMIVVDEQKDFMYEGYPLYLPGGGTSPSAKAVIGTSKKAVDACRKKGMWVFFSRHVLNEWQAKAKWAAKVPVIGGRKSLVAGSDGAEVVPELEAGKYPTDIIFDKIRYSCFPGTNLEMDLRHLGVETVVVIGVSTSFCVRYTSQDAVAADFNVIVLSDCTTAYEGLSAERPQDHTGDTQYKAALKDLQMGIGEVMTSDEFIKLLEKA
ncbi:MAG: cysteine hydrolase family protein [Candidatus Bathyarchaeia archaeon]